MRNFLKNTDTATLVLFYFSEADELRQFESFTREQTPITRPHQVPAQVDVWSVIGKVLAEDRREIVAEFPNELYAEIFRDMAAGFITSLRPGQREAVQAMVNKGHAPKFEVGATYQTRSPGDADCIVSITVKSRTAKTITTTEGKRFRIGEGWEGEETVKPWGSYSMCPVIGATKKV